MKLLYVHGYQGKENGSASTLLREALKKRGYAFSLDAPAFPATAPERMGEMLQSLLSEGHYDWVIASSLGAFYALQQDMVPCILVNPALPDNLLKIREEAPGENPELTEDFLEALRERQEAFFSEGLGEGTRPAAYFIFGRQDQVAGNEDFYWEHCGGNEEDFVKRFFFIDMEHRLSSVGAEKICDILEEVEVGKSLLAQTGRAK